MRLLAQRELEGIPLAILRAFQESYASTAFRCRFPYCDRLSLGFATPESRQEHENTHMRPVYCQILSCQWSRIGFNNKAALKTHTRKHHTDSRSVLIPAKLQRTRDESPPPNTLPPIRLAPPMSKTLFNSEPWTPSFWTQKEKDSFEENIERFGTDWTAFANDMGTKTPEMVERFYDQLVQGGNVKVKQVKSPVHENHVKHTLTLYIDILGRKSCRLSKRRCENYSQSSWNTNYRPRSDSLIH